MQKPSGALIALLLIAAVVPALAQTPAEPAKPVVVGVKALFRNAKGEILLVFDERRQAWEVPGTSHEGNLTSRNLVDGVARDLGITCDDYQLGGLFTYHNPQTGATILRPYYTARFRDFLGGSAFKDAHKTKWFSLAEAKKVIPYPASVLIVEKLLSEPERVWGGAFEESGYTSPMTDRGAVKFRITENFYPLK